MFERPGEWLRRIEYRFNRRRHEALLRQEMEAHRAMLGDAPQFGNVLLHREIAEDVWGWRWLDDLARDFHYGVRALARSPGFSAAAILSLALATGATTAIFSIVNSVLLRPLPFSEPDRLVQVSAISQNGNPSGVNRPDLEAFREQSTSLTGLSSYELTTRLLETPQGSERVTGVSSDPELFAVLGATAIAGRVFARTDPPTVAVISTHLWVRLFNRDPSVIGRAITLTGTRWNPQLQRAVLHRRELTVVGIMGDAFQFPYGAAASFSGSLPEARTDLWVMSETAPSRGTVVARLGPGVTAAAADAELDTLEQRLDLTTPGRYRPIGMQVTPLQSEVLGVVQRSLWLLFVAVGLVLGAACANVANLLLARTVSRTQEVVTRAALGAGPGRLVRQFLCESLVLSLAAGVIGAAVAWWGVGVLVTAGAARIPRAHEIALDWRAFAFLLGTCVAVAVAVGLLPAMIASRADVRSVTQEAGGRATVSSRYGRVRDGLVVAEVALAFVLACGVAGVMRELHQLGRTDPGIITDNVVSLHLTPRAPDGDYFAIEERVRQIPGVVAAGFIQMVPLQNWGWIGDMNITGRPRDDRPQVELRTVTPGYFAALGIPVRGRLVTDADVGDARAILVNETFVRRQFAGEDPLMRATDRGPIVGVVGDVPQERLDVPVVPEIYQVVSSDAGIASDLGMSLIVRSSGAIEPMIPAVRAAVREINPVVAIFNVKTMNQVVADSLWELHLYRWAVGLFAALALVLAAIGLYGVLSYSVSSRMREFAVRLALGAAPARVARLVLRRGASLVGWGLAAGAMASLAIVATVRAVPDSLRPDPLTMAATAALLATVALLACLVPALRVTRVSPSAALRHD